MKPRILVGTAIEDLRAAPRRSVLSLSGIALGVWVLTLIVGAGLGMREVVTEKIVRELPIDHIEVVPRTLDLGIFKVDTDKLFGKSGFDEVTVENLKALPGVAGVYPKLDVQLPMGARGGAGIFGRSLYVDLFMVGVPDELMASDVGGAFVDDSEFIPVVISEQIIELYNSSVAHVVGTPKLTAQTLQGFEFEIVVGRSLMMRGTGAKRTGVERAKIVGSSDFGMKLGATVPMKTADRLLERYAKSSARSYSSIVVRAESPQDVPMVADGIADLGLVVDATAKRTTDLMSLGLLILAVVGLSVLAMAALNIGHSFLAIVTERRREFAVLRALGARRRDVVALVCMQAGLLGLAGALLGFGVAVSTAWLIDGFLLASLPDFPFKPDALFVIPLWLAIAVVGLGAGAALVGGVWPALSAGRDSVIRALGDS
ncbi:MAG: ABC transporter permease [Myxococcota bacterium]|nr:ABC transporter permease [Myxococcota bacterium]